MIFSIMDLFTLTRQLIDIPSVTGDERRAMEFIEHQLVTMGMTTSREPVSDSRWNLYAGWSREASVCFSTHVDTVPPFTRSSEDDDWIYGRGACDTKGIIAAMLMAGQVLLAEGKHPAFLFVVGEETDSIGAKTAAASGNTIPYVIVGEPTENCLATGHKGVLSYTLHTSGVTAHSAYPELGTSAVHVLLDVLHDIRQAEWGHSDVLGPSTLNIGAIQGGRAPNVFADSAAATVLHRIVDRVDLRRRQLNDLVAGRAAITFHSWSDPQHLFTLDGFPAEPVRFGTDIPHLRGMGELLLLGPGSIHHAHTAHEKISKQQLVDAVKLYVDVYNALEALKS